MDNTPSIVYAKGSRSSGSGFKSSSFSTPKSMPKSSSSGSKSSSSGFKSGGFSNTTPKSSTSKNTGSSSYSSGTRNFFIPIPFFSHNIYSSGGYFGAGSIVGGLIGGVFKFILFIIIIVLVIKIINKSKRN